MIKNLQNQFLLLTLSFCFFSIAPATQGAQASIDDQKSDATSNEYPTSHSIVLEEKKSMGADKEKEWWKAIQKGDANKVENLLKKYTVKINTPNIYGMTALHCAAARNSVEVAKLLIGAGANVDFQDKNGMTALHCAAARNSVEVAKLLIEEEVNVDLQANNRMKALHIAALYNNVGVAKLLINTKAQTFVL